MALLKSLHQKTPQNPQGLTIFARIALLLARQTILYGGWMQMNSATSLIMDQRMAGELEMKMV